MTKHSIFWAQALDNSSPDHIELEGKLLDANELERRQEAVSSASSVVKSGNRVFDEGNVLLTVYNNYFVVEVPSIQVDRAGRIAPIVYYGIYDKIACDELAKTAPDSLEGFAKRIGRGIKPEHLELVRKSFSKLKKNIVTKKIIVGSVIGVAASVLLYLVYRLATAR